MSNVSMNMVIKAKVFSDLLKHLDNVSTSLMIQRDDMLEEMSTKGHDLLSASIEELDDMLAKNGELECDVRTLLITEVDKIHAETMKI
ncbi:hypothetical protein [Bacillus sp. AFS075034]|uniref:hypothetical protein n=1 Tax=Bacillus sp. AFS075034 TaxID=2034281 RepID=UPI000BF75D41|nr:hypothetical protein [Bacillus sp. AFS075034]PFW60800.1 hypothetical protein COL20_20420 [Bacillus sp. AFS075034]